MSLATFLTDLIDAKGLTHGQVARNTGLDRSYISRLLAGDRDQPVEETILKLIVGLEMSQQEAWQLRTVVGTGMTPVANALYYLYMVEAGVNVGRPQDLAGGKDAMRSYFMAMIVELSELLQELDWKPWKEKDEIDRDKVADEFADVLAFLGIITANVMSQTGLGFEDLAKAFDRKSKINVDRAMNRVKGYTPSRGVQPCSTDV